MARQKLHGRGLHRQNVNEKLSEPSQEMIDPGTGRWKKLGKLGKLSRRVRVVKRLCERSVP